MKTRFLIIFAVGIIGFSGTAFAQNLDDDPEPEPEQYESISKNCGLEQHSKMEFV